jgi:hypothetical protein
MQVYTAKYSTSERADTELQTSEIEADTSHWSL